MAPDLDLVLSGLLGQRIPMEFKVELREKHGLAPVAALGDVMRKAGNDEAGDARHRERSRELRGRPVTPRTPEDESAPPIWGIVRAVGLH
jgi:hypothetical protein